VSVFGMPAIILDAFKSPANDLFATLATVEWPDRLDRIPVMIPRSTTPSFPLSTKGLEEALARFTLVEIVTKLAKHEPLKTPLNVPIFVNNQSPDGTWTIEELRAWTDRDLRVKGYAVGWNGVQWQAVPYVATGQNCRRNHQQD
jgi:hypothetical protein